MRKGSRRRVKRDAAAVRQLPWLSVENPYAPIEVLRADQIEKIHEASLQLLEEIGIDFLLDEAVEILRAAGAAVERGSQRVRMDRGFVLDQLAHAPPRFTLHARNPAHDLIVGGNHVNFAAIASAPNVADLDRGRRPGNYEDFCNLVRIGQFLNIVHMFGGYPVEPVDLPPETRHLDCVRAFIELSDKVPHAYSLGRDRILDGIEMVRIARGVTRETLEGAPSLFTIVNSSSPLRIDGPMLEGVIEMARHRQVVVLTPFTLSGAMSPATLAGALVQQNAEALAGLAFAQVVNPGTPVVYGGFTTNVDMRSGSPAFGTPEYTRAALAGGQLARRYGLPFRSSNANAANVVDAQAAYEAEMSLWGAVMGHASIIMHGAGWMEGGLCASFEKMILDAELLQMMAVFLQPIEVDDDTMGLEAIAEVGPGGHFFGAAHTLERYETAFYAPMLSDWRNFEAWNEAGHRDTAQRANVVYKKILASFEPPPLDPAVREELDDFVARRKREGGVQAA